MLFKARGWGTESYQHEAVGRVLIWLSTTPEGLLNHSISVLSHDFPIQMLLFTLYLSKISHNEGFSTINIRRAVRHLGFIMEIFSVGGKEKPRRRPPYLQHWTLNQWMICYSTDPHTSVTTAQWIARPASSCPTPRSPPVADAAFYPRRYGFEGDARNDDHTLQYWCIW